MEPEDKRGRKRAKRGENISSAREIPFYLASSLSVSLVSNFNNRRTDTSRSVTPD
jgi:hypothetical protein